MKNFIQNIILILMIILLVGFIASLISRAFVYTNQENARRMEYCISQNQNYYDCFVATYRKYDFDKIIK